MRGLLAVVLMVVALVPVAGDGTGFHPRATGDERAFYVEGLSR